MKQTTTLATAEMAALLMLTPRRLQQLAAQGALPKERHGPFELVATIRAYLAHLKLHRESAEAPERAAVLRERAREIGARNLRAEGELMSRDAASEIFTTIIATYQHELGAFVAEAYPAGPDRNRLAALLALKTAKAEAGWREFLATTRAGAR
ncbi:MAG: hypothetical protein JNK46_09445 [Methylobacteriaceae bacterium]|nr:hypothetical protein [Methylobacteriaceae bacterium]